MRKLAWLNVPVTLCSWLLTGVHLRPVFSGQKFFFIVIYINNAIVKHDDLNRLKLIFSKIMTSGSSSFHFQNCNYTKRTGCNDIFFHIWFCTFLIYLCPKASQYLSITVISHISYCANLILNIFLNCCLFSFYIPVRVCISHYYSNKVI